MHAQTEDRTSAPTTIYARVGAQRALEYGGRGSKLPPSSQGKEQSGSKLPHSKPPRFVTTLEAPLGTSDPLTRIPLAVTGTWVREGSDFSITLGDLEAIVNNFSRRRNGEINVDYDHASEMPDVGAGGPVPSAGRIVKLDAPEAVRSEELGARSQSPGSRGNGQGTKDKTRFILWGWYEPTERARHLIENREYRYISPAINWAGRDKRTGKIDGTTLTSVALTNRPFLEELPQIRLSDPAYQLVDVGDVHVDTSLGTWDPPARPAKQNSGGLMKQVKLSVQDGKLKVAHDDFSDDYFADLTDVKKCLADLGELSDDDLTDDGGDQSLTEQIAALAGLAGHAQETATLSECVTEIRRRLAARQEISLREAGTLLSENEANRKSIAAPDYFRWRVEQELDEAVKNGKVLPRQRDDWRKIALSDFPTFRKIVAEQKPQVALRPVGLSGAGPEDAQTQVKLLAEQRMRERSISFGQALTEIGREQPELVHQYRRAVSGGGA